MNAAEDFPDVEYATDEGLLALGGDLSAPRLMTAYRKGIFPWYHAGQPILWWSPDPRCVLFPGQYKPQRSLKKSIKKQRLVFSFDQAFEEVINRCAACQSMGQSMGQSMARANSAGTWITDDMKEAYINLHRLGYAHSIETWKDDQLVGGLYGIALGGLFFGESMFSRISDASKAALSFLIPHLTAWNFQLVDCQITSPHLLSLGAVEIPRAEFLERLGCALTQAGKPGSWKNIPLEPQ